MVGDWLSLPALTGCIQSGSAPIATPSIAITQITFNTKSYGTNLGDLSPIGVSDQITTVLTPSNDAATIPTDGLAQYYENSDASKQVFHTMQVNYTATNFTINDLPADNVGSEISFITSLGQAGSASGLNTWVLDPSSPLSGGFFPLSAKTTGAIITAAGATRAQVFETSPEVGYDNTPISNGVEFYSGSPTPGNVQGNMQVQRLDRITFAAQNLASSTTMGLAIKVVLSDGTEVTSPTVTITIPADGVKTNIIENPVGINSYTTTTAAYGDGQFDPNDLAGSAVQPFPIPEVMVSALNSGNSFTTPNLDPGAGIGMVQGYDDPGNFVHHSWQVNLNTSALTLSDYPATELIVQYHFTWNADATNIGPGEGIIYDPELGQPASFTTTDDINFTQVVENEIEVDTNTIIPFASVDLPAIATQNTDFNGGWRAYSAGGGPAPPPSYPVNLQVKIKKSDNSFVSSPVTVLTIMNEDGVLPTRV